MHSTWKYVCDVFGNDPFHMDTIGSNAVAFVVFWALSGLLMIADFTGRPKWMMKYKTQPDKNQPVDRNKVWIAAKMVLFNQVFIMGPLSPLVTMLRLKLGCPYKPEDLPTGLVLARDIAVCFLAHEFFFYYMHRLVHWGPLYKYIHKKHHEWTAPVAVVTAYAHPIENIFANVLPPASGPLLMRSHLMTTWLWYAIITAISVIHHSGYHLPLLPSPEFHDFHHLKYNYNYGFLGWLDWLHETDTLFRKSIQFKRDRLCLWTPLSVVYPAEKDGDVDKRQ